MSSSKKKQLRKEQYMTERQAAAAAEAKKLKRYTLTFWVVIALVASIFVGAVLSNPIKNVVYKNTDAVTVGNHTLSSVELNYFYIDAINAYVNQYSSYLTYLGLDTSKPLNKQTDAAGKNWADGFLTSATTTIQQTYALYDLAVKEGHKLTEDEQKSLDSSMSTMSIYAQIYGYNSLSAYLRSVYGNGSSEESYRKYMEVSAMATSYYNKYSDELEYSAEDLTNYQADKAYTFNSYNFASYYLSATKFREGGTKDDKGNITYTDAEKQAAIEACKKAADELAAGKYESLEDFDNAIKELDKKLNDKTDSTAASTNNEAMLYSKINSLYLDWIVGRELKSDATKDDSGSYDFDDYNITAAPKAGDLKVFEYSTGEGDNKTVNGYYVLRYEGLTLNDFAMKNVRHILVAFEGGTKDSSGSTTYSAAEKLTAKEKAEALLKEWESGAKTEDSFAELAKEKSEDTGSASDGGLCDDVYPGQMVEAFEDWCYDDNRNVGDTGIVETEYGYHVMYFVGDSETTYRDYMIENALRSEELEEWYADLTEATKLEILTDKHVKKDLILG